MEIFSGRVQKWPLENPLKSFEERYSNCWSENPMPHVQDKVSSEWNRILFYLSKLFIEKDPFCSYVLFYIPCRVVYLFIFRIQNMYTKPKDAK